MAIVDRGRAFAAPGPGRTAGGSGAGEHGVLGDPYLFPRDVESPERTISLGLRFRR
jgi:hypothetical protein